MKAKAIAALAVLGSVLLGGCGVTVQDGLTIHRDGTAQISVKVLMPSVIASEQNLNDLEKSLKPEQLPEGASESMTRIAEGDQQGVELVVKTRTVQDALDLMQDGSGDRLVSGLSWKQNDSLFHRSYTFDGWLLGTNVKKEIDQAAKESDLGIDPTALVSFDIKFSVTAPDPIESAPGAEVDGDTATWTVQPGKDMEISLRTVPERKTGNMAVAGIGGAAVVVAVYLALKRRAAA